MLKNYFLTSIRNIWRYKIFSAINIICLSMSMAVCFLFIQLLGFHLRFDNFHEKGEDIYRIGTYLPEAEAFGHFYANVPLALMPHLEAHLSATDRVLPIASENMRIKPKGEASTEEFSLYRTLRTTPDFFDFFTFDVVSGKASDLSEPDNLFLIESEAEKIFGTDNPIGKSVWVESDSTYYTVKGILADPPEHSHISYKAIASLNGYKYHNGKEWVEFLAATTGKWDWRNGYLYVLSENPKAQEKLMAALPQILETHYKAKEGAEKFNFQVQRLEDIHMNHVPGAQIVNMELANNMMPWFVPYVGFFIGFLVIASALFNYTNLTLARSLTRFREMGIRKVVGASKWQIRWQIITETVVLSFIALLVALTLLQFLIPLFYETGLPQQVFQLDESFEIYVVIVLFAVFVGLVGGFFPSFFYAKIPPIAILRGIENLKVFSRLGLRKTLIVIQFALSLVWFASGALLYAQIMYLGDKDQGFSIEDIYTFWMRNDKMDLVKEVLSQHPSVQQIAFSNHMPGNGANWTKPVWLPGEEDTLKLNYMSADPDFIPMMEIQMLAGQNFEGENPAQNKSYVILNQLACEMLGLGEPSESLNQALSLYNKERNVLTLSVIGVVDNFISGDVTELPRPLMIRYEPAEFYAAQLHIASQQPGQTLTELTDLWNTQYPSDPIKINFMDEIIASNYNGLFIILRIVSFTALLATLIACLGLLGMVVFAAQNRIREMGIRKILGASVRQLTLLLTRGFVWLLLIASLLSAPIIYFLNQLWLTNFAFRIHAEVWIILASIVVMLLVGLMTILPMMHKTATVNPAEVLRDN